MSKKIFNVTIAIVGLTMLSVMVFLMVHGILRYTPVPVQPAASIKEIETESEIADTDVKVPLEKNTSYLYYSHCKSINQLYLKFIYEKEKNEVHEISKGETLSRISRKYGVSVDAIAEYNRIPNVDLIYAGSSLQIPLEPMK